MVAKKFNLGFSGPEHIVPKGFRLLNVFFCILQALKFVLRSFFLATLPCRSLLFKVRCRVVLRRARPVRATLFCSSFYSDVWVLLRISHQVIFFVFQTLLWLNCSIYLPFCNNVSDSGNRQFETLKEFCIALTVLVKINHLHFDILGQLFRGIHGC